MKIYSGFISEQLEDRVKNDLELIDKPITIFYDYAVQDSFQLKENPYNILFINEPNEYFGLHHWAMNAGNNFDIIFAWNEALLNAYPNNSYLFPFGAGDYERAPNYQKDKKFELSFLCGNKRLVEGHFLRHNIFSMIDRVKIPNNFIYTAPWEDGKLVCWKSMYHIAIENVKYNNWFTEKIIDCFLSKTIPIYWGCPNLGQFFDMNGVITFNNEEELFQIVNNLTPEYYDSKKDVLEKNYKLALEYADFLGRINKIIKEVCNHNNL
jgi:hypothetical protein